jgi:hypothetical protein
MFGFLQGFGIWGLLIAGVVIWLIWNWFTGR